MSNQEVRIKLDAFFMYLPDPTVSVLAILQILIFNILRKIKNQPWLVLTATIYY